jgi:radical SAM superfamily enzyme YgiQ (UPF0313 family)
MSVDLLLVKSVTGGPETFFSSNDNQINGYNLTRDIPLPSIPVLDSWVKSKGYTTGYFDLDKDGNDKLLEKAAEADVIGFYLNYTVHFKVLDAVKRVKKEFPEKLIVIGGPSISNFKEDFYKLSTSRFLGFNKEKIGSYVDAVVYGEGEIALETILKYKDEPDKIGKLIDDGDESSWGIIYKDKKGKLHTSKNSGFVTDLTLLPVPSFALIKGLIPVAFLETSRGCAFKCPFCEMPPMYNSRRVKDEKQVKAEIDYLQELGIKHVIITDPAIYPSKRMEMLSDIFAGRGMTWTGYAKPGYWKNLEPLYSKATLKKARDSGCISLFFGGESASETTQEMYGKPRLEVLLETEKLCKEVGLLSCWSFMVLNPGETSKDVDKLIDLLTELNPAMTVFSPFTVLPDSEIGRNPKKFKVRIVDPNYNLKGAELYSNFSNNAGVDSKEKIRRMIENHPKIMRLLLKIRLRKADYFRSLETGFGLADGAFEMLRLDSALNRNTNIKVGKSNYHLLFEMAATGKEIENVSSTINQQAIEVGVDPDGTTGTKLIDHQDIPVEVPR